MKRSRLKAKRPPAAIRLAQIEALERDERQCLICGATDILDSAHVLRRGYKHERDKAYNIATLCRKHHVAHETEAGRVRLLVLLDERYEYGPFYERPPYLRYWRQRE